MGRHWTLERTQILGPAVPAAAEAPREGLLCQALTFCPMMPGGPISPRGPGSPWGTEKSEVSNSLEDPSLPHLAGPYPPLGRS